MKRNILTLTLVILTLYSCKKESAIQLQEDNGCIERIIIPVTGHSINGADIPVANALFTNNIIDNSKFRYYQYLHDSVQTYFPPYSKFDSKVVKVDEYTKGLRIFTGQLVFEFKNEFFSFKSGYPTNETTLNTTVRYCCKQGRLLSSTAVFYQLRLGAGQAPLGFCLLSFTFIYLFISGWGRTQQ